MRALDHPLHSGMWGGPLPDAATALCSLLGRLTDARGAIAVPGLADDVPELSPGARAALAALPYDEAGFRADSGILAGVPLSGEPGRGVYEQLWARPALAVTALEAMPLAEAANQLIAEARAKVGLRLAPGQDAERAARRLVAFLEADPPRGVRVETRLESAAPGWRTEPVGRGLRRRPPRAPRRLRLRARRDRLRRLDPLRRPLRRRARRRPGAAARPRGPDLQRPRREREPPPRRLREGLAGGGAPAGGACRAAGAALIRLHQRAPAVACSRLRRPGGAQTGSASGIACAYTRSVIAGSAWPSWSATQRTDLPAASARLAQVWRVQWSFSGRTSAA